MFWGKPKTPKDLRLASLYNGRCTQRIYFGSGEFVRCAEYSVFETIYCQIHQPGVTAREMGVFERLPPPPEPIFKVQENVDPSGTDEWSDGRFRNKRGQYAEGRKELKMTPEAIYNRRTKRKYRAKKRKEKHDKQREEAKAMAKALAQAEAYRRRPE